MANKLALEMRLWATKCTYGKWVICYCDFLNIFL